MDFMGGGHKMKLKKNYQELNNVVSLESMWLQWSEKHRGIPAMCSIVYYA